MTVDRSSVLFIGFRTGEAAQQHGRAWGGWVWLGEDGSCLWFAPAFTPSEILGRVAGKGSLAPGGRETPAVSE